jgi:hypothetical protein
MYLQVGVHSCSYTSNYDGGSAWHLPQSSILWGCRAGFAPFTDPVSRGKSWYPRKLVLVLTDDGLVWCHRTSACLLRPLFLGILVADTAPVGFVIWY